MQPRTSNVPDDQSPKGGRVKLNRTEIMCTGIDGDYRTSSAKAVKSENTKGIDGIYFGTFAEVSLDRNFDMSITIPDEEPERLTRLETFSNVLCRLVISPGGGTNFSARSFNDEASSDDSGGSENTNLITCQERIPIEIDCGNDERMIVISLDKLEMVAFLWSK